MSSVGWMLLERLLPLLVWLHLAPPAESVLGAVVLLIAVGIGVAAAVVVLRLAAIVFALAPRSAPGGSRASAPRDRLPNPRSFFAAVGGRGPRAPGPVARRSVIVAR